MAIKVEKRVVCDLGERHTGSIRQWRITVDRETKTMDLCNRCSVPLVALWDRGGSPRRSGTRMQVVSMSEIEGKKKPPTA